MLTSAPFPPCEGMGNYVWNLSRQLTRRGHHVQIVTRGSHRPAWRETIDGLLIWRVTFFPVYPLHVHLHRIFVNRLVEALEEQIDLLHIHSPLVPMVRTKRPTLITFHSTILDDVRRTHLNGYLTLLMKLQAPISHGLEKGNIAVADSITAISCDGVHNLRNDHRVSKDIQIVWNGVDTDLFTPGPEVAGNADTILTVGRLAPGKGLEDLIQVAGMLSKRNVSARFIIVGDGPLWEKLKRQICALRLERSVILKGHISSRSELVDLYRKAALFILPSHHEGLPTVILEAMACGCPVLATGVGGVPQVVMDGFNGRLVPPGQPQRMADLICSLLGSPRARSEMGENGRRTVVERFSWVQISDNFLRLYETLLDGAPV